jgi:hypothetical protein
MLMPATGYWLLPLDTLPMMFFAMPPLAADDTAHADAG